MARALIGVSLIAAGLSVAFISCKSSKEDLKDPNSIFASDTTPLNSKQTSQFDQVISGVARVDAASILASGSSDEVPIADQLTTDLQKAITKAQCTIDYKKDPATTGNRDSHLTVNGNKECPVAVNLKTNIAVNGLTTTYSLLGTFSVTDSDLAKRNDIDDMAISGQGTTTPSEDRKTEKTEISATGKIHSQTLGNIIVNYTYTLTSHLQVNQTVTDGTQKLRLAFPKIEGQAAYAVVLENHLHSDSNQMTSTYTFNGLEISEREFLSYLKKFGLTFLAH